MIKRVLFCATVDIHFSKFHLPYFKWFKENGWEVHVAAAGELKLPFVDKRFIIPIERSPISLKNIMAYWQLKEMIQHNDYALIHCHTPMGGALTRLAARGVRQKGVKVIYTAHGFHFYKGAPILNWILYYPMERWLAHYTDCLITINQEDKSLADQHGFKAGATEHVHGVGVDTRRFYSIDERSKQNLRISYGYGADEILLFYAAEFNENKNQRLMIDALALIKEDAPQVKLLLAGDGPLLATCKKYAKTCGVADRVKFLGYQDQVEEYLQMSDIVLASSIREGLPVNVMEGMACGLPVLASRNRGHNELIVNGVNGYIVPYTDYRLFASRLFQLIKSRRLRKQMGLESMKVIKKTYSLQMVSTELYEIYSRYMEGEPDRGKREADIVRQGEYL
ncbi:glycosyltransferase EpsD [Pullulanibacillus pueri]|uniref:Putative glycosyltransferase EpsD n=1 Tax=Pullulanibacillus pueri TaxID=1437324 RepID=A0A8J3EM40_9BACL|nr:glycosyltransferase family 4 protein [Pullulanibacillus pueri]MBM7682423.1 glycosyltransferase EpsD [Pullulanibacillus pueri]GGH81697.1 putative glycosyltransferase EpsD [Pullulanibacillus pueri]